MNQQRTGREDPIVGQERTLHLIELVGRGPSGDVYVAEQQSPAGFRRRVALKLLNEGAEAGRQVRDDARALGLLNHRHIVAVHDLVRVGGRAAIVMDYVPGADLAQIVSALAVVGTPFPAGAALEIGAMVFDALDHASRRDGDRPGIVHGDVKPSNVRLTVDGDAKVVDFGITRFGAGRGTELYLSPEQLMRESASDAGDVYAASATIVELILGEPLGRSPLMPELHQAFVAEALGRVRRRIEAHPLVVEKIASALERGLHADPTKRPTAGQLQAELQSLARQVDGPTLTDFARWFVPRVDGLLVRVADADSPLLTEDLDTTSEMLVETPEPAPGLMVDTEIPLTTGRGLDNAHTVDDMGKGDNEAGFFMGEDTTADLEIPRRRRGLLPMLAVGLGAVSTLALGVVVLAGVAGLGDEVGAWLRTNQLALFPEAVLEAPSLDAIIPAIPPEQVAFPVLEDPPLDEAAAPAPVQAEAPAVEAPAVEAAPAVLEAPPPDVARVDELVVGAEGASELKVTCGGVSASGASPVRVADFPAGMCTIAVHQFGDTFRMATNVESPQQLQCTVTDGALRCT